MAENIRDNLLKMNLRKCPICGKPFWAGYEWVYRRGYEKSMTYFCSWKCLRQDEADRESKKKKVGKEIRKMIEDGASNAEIKEKLGVTQGQIDYRRESADYERKTGRKKSSRQD